MLRLFRRDSPRVSEILHLDVSHLGETYRVDLKRLKSAKRFTLRVRSATRDVVLTMPARGSLAAAKEFVERHAAWIGTRLARLPEPAPFEPGAIIPLRGVAHRITHCPEKRGTVWIEPATDQTDGALMLLCVAGDLPHVARRVQDYLRREAKRDLDEAVKHHCTSAGVAARSISLRDTTSRWGSCSSSGALNFSWRLVMAPAYVLDYLAAHEVAHLTHMDHSVKFWRLTKSLSADTDRAEAWLKANGAGLHRFGSKVPGED
jgi:predicted metal-dependent hydrolase